MQVVESIVRVRYAETDQMGIVYHANYIIWMEVGRVEYCRAIGVNYRYMESVDDILLTVAGVNCRFISPARYDDEIVVRTWLAQAHARILTFGYEMLEKSSGRLLATGESKHVFCDRSHKPIKLPEKYRSAFGIASSLKGDLKSAAS